MKFPHRLVTTVMVSATLAAGSLPAGASTSSTTVPYIDANATGYIGLCNAAGQQITSGSVNDTPFAWRAVSSVAAPAPYNNAWRTAILMAYQPQNGLLPSEWSGEQMTSSSRYSNPRFPMAAATSSDSSLATFIADFPPRWNGLIQLRLFLGTKNAPAYSLKYSSLDLQVRSQRWYALERGRVNCHSGTSTSIETILLPTSTTSTTSPTTTSTPTTTTTTLPPTQSSGSSTGWWIGAIALVGALAGFINWRSRSAKSANAENSTNDREHPEKG